MTLDDVQAATGGRWLHQPLPGATPLHGGAFDTRALGGAEMFFAFPGRSADGHRFLDRLGPRIRLALVQREVQREAEAPGFTGALLRVEDTRLALRQLAAYLVARHRPRVVALTGSFGKTTAKAAVAHVLAGGRRVLSTPGSYNNEIGVPLTLLGLDGEQDAVVLEFSARHGGDIDLLGRIAPPDIAVLLGVGRAHIGVFGSQEAIFRAKGEIFNHLRPGGLALVAAAQPRLRELAAGHRIQTFGRDEGDFRVEGLSTEPWGHQRFTGVHEARRVAFRAPVAGAHGLYPALVAWAVASELGLPDALVAERLASVPTPRHRGEPLKGRGGAVVVDDTYNASPETVLNLIATLASLPAPEKVLVLGHLSELEQGLGESAALIGTRLAPPLTRCLVYDPCCPGSAERLARAARGIAVEVVADLPALIAALSALDRPGCAIGVKAGRTAHLERAVQGLLGARIDCRLQTCALLKSCTECEAMTAP
jgi:UDP-N-acetylmuramoyl-tripeptide--D-alanyl-D-alanine ligase